MATPTEPGPDWVQGITSLPPQLQGIAVFGIAIGLGFFLGRRFLKRLVQEPPEPKVLAVGEPTTFADMQPVKELVKQLDLIGIQLMKNEVSSSSVIDAFIEHTKQLSRVVDLIGELVTDIKIERERKQDEEQRKADYMSGYQEALEDARKAARSRRRRPAAKGASTRAK